MFEFGEIDEDKIVFSDEAHVWLNGYVNKQNYRFWSTEHPNISISKSLYPAIISLRYYIQQVFEKETLRKYLSLNLSILKNIK